MNERQRWLISEIGRRNPLIATGDDLDAIARIYEQPPRVPAVEGVAAGEDDEDLRRRILESLPKGERQHVNDVAVLMTTLTCFESDREELTRKIRWEADRRIGEVEMYAQRETGSLRRECARLEREVERLKKRHPREGERDAQVLRRIAREIGKKEKSRK